MLPDVPDNLIIKISVPWPYNKDITVHKNYLEIVTPEVFEEVMCQINQ